MNTPLLTWIIVIATVILAVLFKLVAGMHSRRRHHRHHLVTMSSENAEVYVPGDELYQNHSNDLDLDM